VFIPHRRPVSDNYRASIGDRHHLGMWHPCLSNCENHLNRTKVNNIPTETERVIRIPGMASANREYCFETPVTALFLAMWRSHPLVSVTVAYQSQLNWLLLWLRNRLHPNPAYFVGGTFELDTRKRSLCYVGVIVRGRGVQIARKFVHAPLLGDTNHAP
jgi:hypothetical protein